MQQWLAEGAVGGRSSPGVDVIRLLVTDGQHPVSAVTEARVGLFATPASGDVGSMLMAAFALVVLGLAAVAIWQADLPSVFSGGNTVESESGATETAHSETTDQPAEAATVGGAAVQADAEPAEPEQLTDQELIVDILESNEGRMKQAKIVDETGWSKSKVSMLLSEMEDDGSISKLRVGRENIISLSGNEPEAAGSPFDDE